ncbi:putative serine/threonine kinase [Gloeothece citriformis PCC 7424]|uniref:Putative serine/threonine kinase n=1 Tax=Gloeothece citriformis (strain PCC 7424) TaxID=65393 RepID=B7KB65_GLOC7|nr:substrate-binding domain-containing protein [Gloeothece citriformis]ACK70175.1 putative serine/threonine kinase [Gloeothece citriformis PCC 7424]
MYTHFFGKNPLFNRFPCPFGNPLSCNQLRCQAVDNPSSNECITCGFPSFLPVKTQIIGKKGRYQVQEFLGARGIGRIYKGISLMNQQDVLIKEYFLPLACFTPSEIKIRQQNFEKFNSFQLIDGRKTDYRVIIPQEAIIDIQRQRCYTITDLAVSAISLRNYLEKYGKMTEKSVWQFLDQVLQSLLFLHRQKIRFSFGLFQTGMTHGNLSLESILILLENQSFLIYLTDLAIWERTFEGTKVSDLSQLSNQESAMKQDLLDLGYVAFYLLAGTSVDVEGKPIHPHQNEYWQNTMGALKDYLFNLMGLGTLSLNTVELARQELLKIGPQITPSPVSKILLPQETSKTLNFSRLWWIGGGILALILLSLLIYWLVKKIQSSPSILLPFSEKEISQVSNLPANKIFYSAIQGSSWDYVYTQKNLVKFSESLENLLKEKQPNLYHWQYRPLATTNIKFFLNNFTNNDNDNFNFSIVSPLNSLSTQYKTFPIAYDAIAVFVAFNYTKRKDGLPYALQGKITFDQLRLLYTGKIKNWQELNPRWPNLPVKLYIPTDPEVEEIFKAKILKEPQFIAEYEALLKPSSSNSILQERILRRRTYGKEGILQSIIRDFEENNFPIGSIGFDSLSKIMGQCSVYPLAISSRENSAISPLIRQDNQEISPLTNLCNQKGSYQVNHEAIRNQTYPLSYLLEVVYFRDNRRQLVGDKFAEILKTKEGQCLLKTVQLTPFHPVNCPQP